MYPADRIREMLRALPDGVAIRLLGLLEAGKMFQAERLAESVLADGSGMELCASIVRMRTQEGVRR